jgi:predicted enzyme related to lactoylglutathione lyase
LAVSINANRRTGFGGAAAVELFLIEVRVRDGPAAWTWFRDVLGLSLRLLDAPNRFALLTAGDVGLAVKVSDDGPPNEGFSLVFRVDDLDAERARLVSLGNEVGKIIENAGEGYREFRVAGPEGVAVRLFAWIGP